jgi:cation diffusion facilitator CzcD-associated flavoprotein CzcO
MGNTGAEIALDLSEQNIETYISVRSPVNIIPRSFLGNPVQKTAYKLARLPNWLSDWIGAQVPKIAFGDLSAYGLRRPSVAPAKQLRETGKTPVIDVGAVAQIKKEKIRVVTEIAHLEEREVHFKDGSTLTIDAIILATGYRHNLKSLIPESDTLFNRDGLPSTYAGSGYHEGLYFLGFDNYKSGGILGIIHSESGKIAAAIKAKKPS